MALACRAHSAGDYAESELFGQLGPREKGAVLVVHFGTSYDDTRIKTIDAINARMREAFSGTELREAWTSRMIVRKLKGRGIEKMTPSEALRKLHDDGFTHVLVQSTNIIEGQEMKELRREVESLSLNFKDIRIGNPLLYTPEDYVAVIRALTQAMDMASKGSLKLLVGHGTPDPATACYAMLDYMLKAEGYRDYHVGTVEGYPAFEEALSQLKAGKLNEVVIVPFMFVAGDHARNDIAGEWKGRLEKEGFKVRLYLKGLGENRDIQNLFIDHARFAAGHKMIGLSTRKKGYAIGKQNGHFE